MKHSSTYQEEDYENPYSNEIYENYNSEEEYTGYDLNGVQSKRSVRQTNSKWSKMLIMQIIAACLLVLGTYFSYFWTTSENSC